MTEDREGAVTSPAGQNVGRPPGFSIRPQTEADDVQVIDLYNSLYPEFPAETVEDYRFQVQNWIKQGMAFRRWVAEADGKILGMGMLLEFRADEPGVAFVDIGVASGSRRRGIGNHLAQRLLEDAKSIPLRSLVGEFLDSHTGSAAFAQNLGFEQNGRGEQLTRLDVRRANLTGFQGLESELEAQGLRVELMADVPMDEEFMHALHELDMTTHRDIPSSFNWAGMDYDEWLEVAINGPGRSPKWAWVVLEGSRPIGMARLRLQANRSATNAYTGVHADYRGRGVARALKNRTIEWCRQNGVDFIFTGNEVENHRMLAINMSLGYELLPRTVEVVRHLQT